MTETDRLAHILLDYMRLDMPIKKAVAIIGMGALDVRIAERAAQLFLDGYGDYIIFTGGFGKVTKHIHTRTEAERFSDAALAMGVPKNKILLETKATNAGENIALVQKLLQEKGLHPRSLLVVTKPYIERRMYAAYKKQWRDTNAEILVTSPQLSYEEHFNEQIPKDLFLNILVGDLLRIKEYPKLGFQIEQDIPDEVWQAYEKLVAIGYTKYIF